MPELTTLGPYDLGPNQTHDNGIYTGDCRDLATEIPDASVDLIFTDPPYKKASLYLYDWLAKEAPRVLKPNGFALIYVGTYWKDEVMAMLRPHLSYYFDFILVNGGKSPVMWARKVISRHKSIIAYRQKSSRAHPRTNVLSLCTGSGKDKRYHAWGQDEQSARYLIDCFSDPDDTVWDPFCGGGTTAKVCTALARRYLAFENDWVSALTTRTRLAEPPDPA